MGQNRPGAKNGVRIVCRAYRQGLRRLHTWARAINCIVKPIRSNRMNVNPNPWIIEQRIAWCKDWVAGARWAEAKLKEKNKC